MFVFTTSTKCPRGPNQGNNEAKEIKGLEIRKGNHIWYMT